MVVRLAGDEVAGNGDQLHGRLVEPGVVERLQAVGDLVEGELAPAGVAGAHEALHGQITPVVAVLRVEVARAAVFAGHVVVAAQRTRRHADDALAEQLLIHEEVQHAGRELAAHGAAFQHEVHRDGAVSAPKRARATMRARRRVLRSVLGRFALRVPFCGSSPIISQRARPSSIRRQDVQQGAVCGATMEETVLDDRSPGENVGNVEIHAPNRNNLMHS